jgi:hypothetical protein
MIWTAALVVLFLWLIGFSFNVGGGLIHALLVVILVLVVIQLVA